MRIRIAVVGAAGALAIASASAAAPARTAPRFVPDAVAFRDRMHGVLGTGWVNCGFNDLHCRPSGALEITSDGGRTWNVVRRTPRPVIALTRVDSAYVMRYDDGETLRSRDGRTWHAAPLSTAGVNTQLSVCPQGMTVGTNAGATDWSLCTTQPGAGNQGKAVYRFGNHGWRRVAYTPFSSAKGYGGIGIFGYPIGIAGNEDGFGIIWESRGTLYVTRDGGHHWHGLPTLARPDLDFGSWAYVLPRGRVGFAVLSIGGTEQRRLVETTDAGRTWRLVHRWR